MYPFEYLISGHARLSHVLSVHSNPVFELRSGFTLPIYVYPRFCALFCIMMKHAESPVVHPGFGCLHFLYHKYVSSDSNVKYGIIVKLGN
jgi:hypothetical protein